LKSKIWKIIVTIFLIIISIILYSSAILTKTHLAFGGEYFSSKNIKITIGIVLFIIIVLSGAFIVDQFTNDEKDKNKGN